MRIGLFGGTFDPVHYGHLLLAESCREQCRLDRVVFVPAGIPPHKRDRELTPGDARVEMLWLAIAGCEAFEVSRYEVDRTDVSYTIAALRHFQQQAPGAELSLLVGADMLLDLPHWREAEAICEAAVVVAVRRGGVGEPDFDSLAGIASPERIALFRSRQVVMPAVGFSSSELRRRAGDGRSLRFLTPRAVEAYLHTHGLYRPSESPSRWIGS
jgi:nicotinate-nucleotide adenylyltransferase